MLGSGEVLARAGEDPDKPEYVVSLFLTTDYSPEENDPMPYWCKELLQSKGAPFFTLATAVHSMDLTAFTKVKCYQCHHECRAQLEADRHAIIAKLNREDEELASI